MVREDGGVCRVGHAGGPRRAGARSCPPRYAKGYLDWLSEKRDWPVSRQLWWGHRIPIWSRAFASAAGTGALRAAAGTRPGVAGGPRRAAARNGGRRSVCRQQPRAATTLHICLRDDADELAARFEQDGFRQEDDVLDTWFSSALWPHSTLGWPQATPELQYFYPTSVLITSRDIITLWVARMVLTGLNNMGEVPFRDVYIHPKILDGYGETHVEVEGERCRSDRRDRQVRPRCAAVRPGLPDHRNARCAHAGPVRMSALRTADRPDEEEPRDAADRVRQVPAAVPDAVGADGRRSTAEAGCGGERAIRGRTQLLQQVVECRSIRDAEPRELHRRRPCRTVNWRSKTTGFSVA